MRQAVTFFVRYPIWGWMLLLVIALGGFVTLSELKKAFFPEIEQRIINVEVAYPGAAPEEMEEGVTLKIEQALRGVEGVEEVTSVSRENSTAVKVEGKKGHSPDELLQDVKNAVDGIPSFPVGAEKPVVYKQKTLEDVASLVLKGGDLRTLKTYADRIEDELLASGMVSQIKIQGAPPPEISIELDEETLRRYRLRFTDVAAAVRSHNLDIAAGSIKSNEEELLIRARNKRFTAAAVSDIVVKIQADGGRVRVRDVATVREQFADLPEKTLHNLEEQGNLHAVTIKVQKVPEEDLIEIADYLKTYCADFSAKYKPLTLLLTNDRSITIRQRIDLLMNNGVMGFCLVLISLSLFLSTRLAFWVAFAIPISFLGMFIVAWLAGITLNVLSLFGMILVVGILVDDGIVIAENIYTHYERGKTKYQAAIDGAIEVLPSVLASVLTTIVAFIPFFFLESRLGEAIYEMSVVVIACLAFSLLEGFFLLPDHLSHSGALRPVQPGGVRAKFDWVLEFMRNRLYGRVLKLALRHKYVTLALTLGFIMLVMGLMKGEIIKTTFFPFVDSDNINVALTMPPGTRETKTEDVLRRVEAQVWAVNKALKAEREDSLDVVLSTRIDIDKVSGENATMEIELLDGETRNQESFKIAEAIRKQVGVLPEADKFTLGGRQIFGKPVVMSLSGANLEELNKARGFARTELAAFPQLKDVTDNELAGKREAVLELKPLAYALGFTTSDLVRQIRQGFFGEEVQRLQIGKDEVKVWVRYAPENRKSIGQLEEIKIKAGEGREYPLTDLVSYRIERHVVAINHINGKREIKVEADAVDQNEPVPPLIAKIQADIVPRLQAQYPGVGVRFEGQNKEGAKFGRSISRAFPPALVVMFLIIALTFRSVPQALVVTLMIPLGIFGAIMGHGIEGKPVSVLSLYGIVALAGVVVNDSVVLVCRFNDLLKEGMSFREAVYEAGISRFRAILLTSVTTVAGLYPLILEKSRQAQFLIPMAISVAWGIAFATVFTLLILPTLLSILNDIRIGLAWLWTGRRPTREEMEPSVRELNFDKEL